MKRNQLKCLATLALLLMAVNLNAAELLGRISDETEVTKAAVAVKGDSKLIYRVICSPDDEEPTSDCEKPPVEDAFNPIVVDEMPQMPDEGQVEKVANGTSLAKFELNQNLSEASLVKVKDKKKSKHSEKSKSKKSKTN